MSDLTIIAWIAIVLIVDNLCAGIAIDLMWKHLKESEAKDRKLPVGRYYKVVAMIGGHAFLDIIALIGYASAKLLPNLGATERAFIAIWAATMTAIHVGFYPIVYCGVRDLKFHDQIRERLKSSRSAASQSY